MDINRNKGFTVGVTIFGLVFLAGVGLGVTEFIGKIGNDAAIEKNSASLKKLTNRGNAFALTEENVAAAKANNDKIAAATAKKLAELAGAKGSTLVPNVDSDSAGTFTSTVLDAVNKRTADLQNEKIVIADQAKFFGFSRYLQNASAPKPAADAVPTLVLEQNVIFTLTDALVAARTKAEGVLRGNGLLAADKRLALMLKDVRREAAELASQGTGVVQKDELSLITTRDYSAETGVYPLVTTGNSRGEDYLSLRRPGAIDAKTIQIGFVSVTPVLRNFLETFSSKSEYPIFVRNVTVAPATANDIGEINLLLNPEANTEAQTEEAAAPANDFNFFGGSDSSAPATETAPAEPALPDKISVQPESLSEFVVTFEYVAPAPKKSEPAEDKEGE